ncbi:MAG: transposase [Bacilli bacterium]
MEAVKNAIIYDYSNAVTEGFNNKTKVIKRLMYERCSQELLKIKVLS